MPTPKIDITALMVQDLHEREPEPDLHDLLGRLSAHEAHEVSRRLRDTRHVVVLLVHIDESALPPRLRELRQKVS